MEKESRFTGMDRKASSMIEFTIRQYRTKLSTWVVLGVGLLAMTMILLFHVEAQTNSIEDIDNDLDSFDFDGDGYPNGQEVLWGTDIRDGLDHPGLINSSILPDDPSMYINEDDFDWELDEDGTIISTGKDDDGDCLKVRQGSLVTDSQKDSNENGVACDMELRYSQVQGVWTTSSDRGVDEDPDENEYYHEALHRAFVIGFGKVGFILLIGIFLPLFLATGLIRQEMENETLHYLVGKPIHRAEVMIYRLLGFMAIAVPYITALVLICAIVVGLAAPGEGMFRLNDLGIWLGVMLASWLMVLVYGALFMTFGMIHRLGMIAAIVIGVWEFVIAMITLANPELFVARLSVVFWGMTMVDACANMVYPDTAIFLAMGRSVKGTDDYSFNTGYLWTPENLPGTNALAGFWNEASLGISPFMTLVVCILTLLTLAALTIYIGQTIFKGKEIH